MTDALTADEAVERLRPDPGHVVLMCGLAGSGKTTFSKRLAGKGFLRLSMDEPIWTASGRFGLDFNAADYPGHLEAARGVIRERLIEAMRARMPAVVDSAFWNRAARDDYKALVKSHGAWSLVYLKAAPDLLRRRLAARNRRFDANAQFPVTDAMLERFLASFEAPVGEGELLVLA
jgi:predicted kinase